MGRLAVAAAAGLAALVLAPHIVFASPARPAAACARGYSYGGYASRTGVRGAAASIAATRVPTVASGHAAAWVGVGGVHQARGGSSAWLQAGVAAFSGQGLRLYVEEVSAGRQREFSDLGRAEPGRRYRVAVVETAPDVWQATVEGRAVGEPAYLPTGGESWRAVATAESWTAGPRRCNSFDYRFDRVAVLAGLGWTPLADAQLVGRGVSREGAGFSAASKPS